MFGGKLGVPELLIILGIALVFFGPGKLGDLGKSLGDALGNLRGALKENKPTPSAASVVDQKSTDTGQRQEQQPSRWNPLQ